ncbi:MAG: hypothetical protein IJ056_06510 [Acidaminococcaceae bacterium]|nr:hypothetical protein [Acidaminococcaceae bacterium]
MILLELNLLFMMIILVSGIYCNSVQGICKNCKKLLADIEIARAARYTEGILRRELSYNSTQVRLSKDYNNRDQIVCQKTFKNVRMYWYLSGNVMYRKTIKGTTTGINPYSDTDIKVLDFHTIPLGNEKIGIIMTLKDSETGLVRTRSFTVLLSNSSVTS